MQKFWHYTTTTLLTFIASSLPVWSLTAPMPPAATMRPILVPRGSANEPTKIALHKTTCTSMNWSNGPIVHAGKLWLNSNGRGRLTVKFYNTNLGRPESIDLTMSTENTPQGILLVGSNPVYSGTRRRHPTYSPDNFLIRIDENGRYTFFAFDLNRNTSGVDVGSC